MDPRKKKTLENYSLIANYYANDNSRDFAHFEYFGEMVDLLEKKGLSGKPITDLGSGHGLVVEYLLEKNPKLANLTAVDNVEGFCEMMKNKFDDPPVKVVCREMTEYTKTLPDNSTGAFTLNYSIIHIPDEEADEFIACLFRKTIKGGFLVLSCLEGKYKGMIEEPYTKNKDPRLKIKEPLEIYINEFQTKELHDRLKNAGYTVLKIESFPPADPTQIFPHNRIFVLAEKV